MRPRDMQADEHFERGLELLDRSEDCLSGTPQAGAYAAQATAYFAAAQAIVAKTASGVPTDVKW